MKEKGEINISELFKVFLKSSWLIAIVAVLLAAILGTYSMFVKTDEFSSKTTLMVSKDNTTVDSNDLTLASKMVETYKVVIYSDNFLNSVINDINKNPDYSGISWDLDVKSLSKMFEIKQRGETEVFDVIVTTDSAKKSFAIANTIANHVKENLPEILPYPEGVIFTSIIDPAAIPETPNSKNTLRNSVLGFLIGAILSMVVIFFVWYNDVIIRTEKDIENSLDMPVLGVIPRY